MFNEKALIRLEEIFKFLSGWNSLALLKANDETSQTLSAQFSTVSAIVFTTRKRARIGLSHTRVKPTQTY